MMTAAPTRPTPVLTDHARERCVEMGISTKVAKAIYRHAEITRPVRMDPTAAPRFVATSSRYPEFSVLFVQDADGRVVIVTVLYRREEDYGADRKKTA